MLSLTARALVSVSQLLAETALVLTTLMSSAGPLPPVASMPIPAPLESKAFVFVATVTAYSSNPDETWGDPLITASGKEVFDGLVACPREFEFGTRFEIQGRVYECQDRLHPKYDSRFDIWMPSKEEAVEFGRQVVEVVALGEGSSTSP